MQLTLEESEKKLTSDELSEFSRYFDGKVPLSFINFYIKFNGGYPPDNDEGNFFLLGGFNSIKYGDLPVERIYSDLVDDFPDLKNMIPFAYDEGGNCFLLSLKDENHGYIYIWLMDEKELVFISESFDIFINKLSRDY
ncbi:SMI1/KNR4 family protein [Salmonella enterica subsp. enterica serovar Kua]|nr:SMI1/KNR4 family protein [Salmonella enterica]EBG8225045.1 SMI1/KNR4 family protein [Salmonella enterica subsp. enterica]EBH8755966.1 SMI1/KNR4 family protein [Salmonella enterica subsp. houtenae serovar 44:z4,z23:-]EBW9966516.1 SMI1/KNR4 family protein [Salmonella enterica subsp. enterica serovar Malstatt]ECA9848278.1 SMI1/KNR4 family protein [Salmonella enterica subsp. enterica serovar Essen]EED8426975.1 SMI1/KNR4 family protein [Salmonella enterica subsp. enterica serovar Losangeles]EEI